MKVFATLAACALLGLSFTVQAEAGARAWVSSTGNDSGTCLVAAPCRTFQYAHDHLDPGGEIDVKDPGGYGPVNINRSIAIVADGVLATVGGQGGGFAVNVINTSASDVVLLRGLTINGTDMNGGGGFAVGTGKVTIDHCTVKGVGNGVSIIGNAGVVITNNIFTVITRVCIHYHQPLRQSVRISLSTMFTVY